MPRSRRRHRMPAALQPINPLAPRPPHFPGQGEAGPAHLLHRRGQPPRYLGLQARAAQAARPADAGRGEADHVPGGERQPGPEPLEVQAAGADRQVHFRPAAAPGRMRRRPVLHSLADLEDEHPRAGRDVHEHGLHARGVSQHRRLGQLCARDREPGPARVRGDPRPAGRPAARTGELDQRLPAGGLPGDGVQRQPADQPPRRGRPKSRPATTAAARDFLRLLNDEHLEATPRRHRALRPDRRLRAGRPDAAERPEVGDLSRESPATQCALRPGRPEPAHWPASAAIACSPAGCWSAGSGSSRCSTAPSRWARACSTGTATAASSPTTTATARSSTSPRPRS